MIYNQILCNTIEAACAAFIVTKHNRSHDEPQNAEMVCSTLAQLITEFVFEVSGYLYIEPEPSEDDDLRVCEKEFFQREEEFLRELADDESDFDNSDLDEEEVLDDDEVCEDLNFTNIPNYWSSIDRESMPLQNSDNLGGSEQIAKHFELVPKKKAKYGIHVHYVLNKKRHVFVS